MSINTASPSSSRRLAADTVGPMPQQTPSRPSRLPPLERGARSEDKPATPSLPPVRPSPLVQKSSRALARQPSESRSPGMFPDPHVVAEAVAAGREACRGASSSPVGTHVCHFARPNVCDGCRLCTIDKIDCMFNVCNAQAPGQRKSVASPSPNGQEVSDFVFAACGNFVKFRFANHMNPGKCMRLKAT